ncbi:hypothetical protein FC84_GL001622 [Lapidilactobacillus dextrinicus DSM 20335]|uniref:Helix-turn-helix domain-containing protein n=1 Tax=Lapidilactobacillus dextrinicus DSM 20335 TaxID=1423738 RepID=A0A0R2BV91_9LACO|nr:hypothetical protein [Lapidilactobacillus dextrinicus]KRM79443.1 hypothetical protein FC84_GL001622 [Lapidilactobacillus dextrinicus DSM 20335]QFG46723.1 hypothetical protein LH506_04355 [Lapidilactobacillus dextrinicus]
MDEKTKPVNGLVIIPNVYKKKEKPKKRERKQKVILPIEKQTIDYFSNKWNVSRVQVWRWTKKKYTNPPLPSQQIGRVIRIPVDKAERWYAAKSKINE